MGLISEVLDSSIQLPHMREVSILVHTYLHLLWKRNLDRITIHNLSSETDMWLSYFRYAC